MSDLSRCQEPLLRLDNVSKVYASPVVDGVCLDIYPGEVHALLGENGAGKSTLSKIIAGIIPLSTGQMKLNGELYNPFSIKQAEAFGVRMVTQEHESG